jgi:hypothetical protein
MSNPTGGWIPDEVSPLIGDNPNWVDDGDDDDDYEYDEPEVS